jgi:hypothetical protein
MLKNLVVAVAALLVIAGLSQACNPVVAVAAPTYNTVAVATPVYTTSVAVVGVVHPVVNQVAVIQQRHVYVPQTVAVVAGHQQTVQTRQVTRTVTRTVTR